MQNYRINRIKGFTEFERSSIFLKKQAQQYLKRTKFGNGQNTQFLIIEMNNVLHIENANNKTLNLSKIIFMSGLDHLPLLIENLKSTKPEKIILFGSYAYGNPDEGSDLDILVVTGDDFIPSDFSEKSKIYLKVACTISEIRKKIPVDLIVHTKGMHNKFIKLNSLFARELLTNGIVLYEKDN